MGLFHKELDEQINEMMIGLKNNALKIPENWHWLNYNTKLTAIEEEDLSIIKKLNELHKQGQDVDPFSKKILQLCTELYQYIEKIRTDKDRNHSSDEEKKIISIIEEISKIYSRELFAMHQESKKLAFDNSVVQESKKNIIDYLNQKDAKWDVVQMAIRDLLCTRQVWDYYIKGEKDMFKLISKGAIYEKHYIVYQSALTDIETEINKNRQMIATRDGSAWFHIETSPEMKSKHSFFGFSMKIYATIDVSSVWDVLKYLLKLADLLRQIGIKYNDQINVKIPGSFLSFIKHTDSIVIHYHNHAVKSEIESALKSWLSKYNIKTTRREYDRTEYARDTINSSFSDNVAQTAANLMKHNYGKMSNEALAISGINYAFKMSRESL
ncbi:MAG: hypothetical protein ACP5OA_06170 [Candidatus Woesearchaeota archaeon]